MKYSTSIILALLMFSGTTYSNFDPDEACIDRLDKAYSLHYEKIFEMAKGNKPDLISDLDQIKTPCGQEAYEGTVKSIGYLLFGSQAPSTQDELCMLDIYRAYSFKLTTIFKENGIAQQSPDTQMFIGELERSKYCSNNTIDLVLNKLRSHTS